MSAERLPSVVRRLEDCTAINIVLDVDNTLIPGKEHSDAEQQKGYRGLDEFCNAYAEALPSLNELGKLCFLSINTGNTITSYLGNYEEKNPAFRQITPLLDAKVTSVGTEVHFRVPDGSFSHDTSWPPAVNWNPEGVRGMLEYVPRLEKPPLSDFDIKIQPDAAQTGYKLSYDIFGLPEEGSPQFDAYINWVLKHASTEADVALSYDKRHNFHYLDFLPLGVNKGSAALHVGERCLANALASKGQEVPSEASLFTVVGVDSDNDRSMTQIADLAILPLNAHRSFVDWAEDTIPHKLYRANASFATGIHEGLAHYGIL